MKSRPASLDHFLITRFYVRIKSDAALPGEAWLIRRLEQFERVCLPSVAGQTEKHFGWLVFVDHDCPNWVLEYLHERLPENAEIVVNDGACTRTNIAAAVARRAKNGKIITSRVDSDDGLRSDFIERVQLTLREHHYAVLNFPRGYQLSRGRMLLYSHPSNAFISMVEPKGEQLPVTVFADWHDRISRHAPLIQGAGDRLWVQNCHGENVRNQERGIAARHDAAQRLFPGIPLRRQSALKYAVDVVKTSIRVALLVAVKPNRIRRILVRG